MGHRSSEDFVARLRHRAAAERKRIAFPESSDPRVLQAVEALHAEGIVSPVLIRGPGIAASRLPAGVPVIDTRDSEQTEPLVASLHDRRRGRRVSDAEAEALARDPLIFANDLVRHGEVDGCVAGCVYTTAEVMRAALWLVGPMEGVRTVSSAFYMVTPPFRGDQSEVLTFTDCAVVRYPTAEQLADIGIAAAQDRRRIVGDTPVVAFLSFSTTGSAEGESVSRVREAVALVRSRVPELAVDGELQGDAALVAAVAHRKAPASSVAGNANILVFPALDSGNISYKLVERIGRSAAIGPILQGLARPCNDLSRGASADDIINVAAVTALQAHPF
ncbi:MAG: phosphate acetyltransferase [Gemmatimonadaceae bacterium]